MKFLRTNCNFCAKQRVNAFLFLGRQKTAEELRNGVWLCKLMNQLNPNKKIKINTPKSTNSTIPPFKCMENIGNFLTACKDYGLKPGDLFQTSDLYDATNMLTVINCIHAVGRKAQTNGYQGPVLGPRESDTNVREFSEEKLRAGDVIIGLQMGSNKGATQAGLIMGKNRSVLD